MSNLISVADLAARLSDPALRLVDVRASLVDPRAGRRWYEAGHLPGALFLSLDDDLAGPVAEHGGRHPLPDLVVGHQVVLSSLQDSDHVVHEGALPGPLEILADLLVELTAHRPTSAGGSSSSSTW